MFFMYKLMAFSDQTRYVNFIFFVRQSVSYQLSENCHKPDHKNTGLWT